MIDWKQGFLRPNNQGQMIASVRQRIYYISVIGKITAIICTCLFYVTMVNHESVDHIKLAILITCGAVAFYIAGMLILKRSMVSLNIVGHITILGTTLLFFLLTHFVGGGLNLASITPLVTIAIGSSFVILGFYSGLFWSAVIGALFLFLLYLNHQGIEFQHIIKSPSNKGDHTLAWVLSLILLSFLFIAYEWLLHRLSNEHGGNYSQLHKKYHEQDLATTIVDRKTAVDYLSQSLIRNQHYGDKVSTHIISLPDNADKVWDSVIANSYERALRLARGTDIAMRISQKELLVIYENVGTETNHQLIKRDLHTCLNEQFYHDGLSPDIEIQVHSALYPDTANTVEKLLRKLNT